MARVGAFKISQDLIRDVARHSCVLFVGADLSREAGLPDWPCLLQKMMEWAEAHGVDFTGVRRDLNALIKERDYPLVAEELRERMGKERFRQFMTEVFRDDKLHPTDTHRLLPYMPFAALVTTNYDILLERAYALKDGGVPPTYTQEDIAELSSLHRDGKFYILKLHGHIDRIETIVLGHSCYGDVMFANNAYRAFLNALFLSRTVLFLGVSPTDFDLLLFLEEMRTAFRGYGRSHYALMSKKNATPVRRRGWERRYGIQVIPYATSQGYSEVCHFLEELRDEVSLRVS
jgi:hypothetical protein